MATELKKNRDQRHGVKIHMYTWVPDYTYKSLAYKCFMFTTTQSPEGRSEIRNCLDMVTFTHK